MMIIFIKHANRHKISTWILDVTFSQAIRGLEPPQIFVELRYFYLSAPIILSASNVFCHLDDDGQLSFVFFRLISIEFAWVCPPEVHRHCDLVLQMFQCIYNHRYWLRLSHLYEKGKTFILESSFCYIKGYHDFPDMYPEHYIKSPIFVALIVWNVKFEKAINTLLSPFHESQNRYLKIFPWSQSSSLFRLSISK